MTESLRSVANKALCASPRFFGALLAAAVMTGGTASGGQSPADTHQVELSAAERHWIERTGTVRVVPTPDWAPLEYVDEGGDYRGVSRDVLDLIERRTGLEFEAVEVSGPSRGGGAPDPSQLGGDLVPLSAPTAARLDHWLFSEPYLLLPAIVVVRQGATATSMRDLRGKTLAVVEEFAARRFVEENHPEIDLSLVDDAETGLLQVSFGLVDGMVTELPTATAAMQQLGLTNLKVAAETGYVYELSISVRRDWPELMSIVQKGLDTITPSEMTAINRRWYSIDDGRRKRWLAVGGTAVFTLAMMSVLVSLWNRKLASLVKDRTASLEAELQARATAEQERDESELNHQRFRSLVPDAVVRIDVDPPVSLELDPAEHLRQVLNTGRLAELNHQAQKLPLFTDASLGMTMEEMRARSAGLVEPRLNELLKRCAARQYALMQAELVVTGPENPGGVTLDAKFVGQVENGHVLRLWIAAVEVSELARYRERLQRLAGELGKVSERERRALAHRLHDGPLQGLALTKNQVSMLLAQRELEPHQKTLSLMSTVLDEVIQQARDIMYDLRPPGVELGLGEMLEGLAERIRERWEIDCRVVASEPLSDVPRLVQDLVFEAVRESVSNAIKHAAAETVEIRLERTAESLRVTVRDDGSGFDPRIIDQLPNASGGFGLFSLKERLQMAGGQLEVQSGRRGTVVVFELPLETSRSATSGQLESAEVH